MEYLTDPHAPDLIAQLENAVAKYRTQHCAQHAQAPTAPALSVYALLDGAVDPEWGSEIWAFSQRPFTGIQAVYADTALADAQECGLFLGLMEHEQLPDVLARTQARPCLSFIQSSLSLDALRAHLAQFSRAQTPDGLWFVLRWGCPNRVGDLLEALTPAQRAHLLAGFAAWHLIGRDGSIHTIEGKSQTPPPSAAGLLRHGVAMQDAALHQLADTGQADALLIEALQESGEIRDGRSASLMYRMAVQVLRVMDELGIEEHPRRLRLLIQSMHCNTFEDAQTLLQTERTRTTV